jgi:hypothetical protein
LWGVVGYCWVDIGTRWAEWWGVSTCLIRQDRIRRGVVKIMLCVMK